MPSRAELRRPIELALRAALLVVLGVAFWRSMAGTRASGAAIRTNPEQLQQAVRQVLSRPDVKSLELNVSRTPTRAERDALRALRDAGVVVRWNGNVSDVAVEVVADRDPGGGSEIRVIGGSGQVVVRDSAGAIDTLR